MNILKSNAIKLILPILLLLLSCFLVTSCKKESSGNVFYSGALRTMMSGNLEATASLDSLSKKSHLYALGAFENLKGEIQIFDGKAINSTVQTNELVFDKTFDKKAALLVYAEVANWQDVKIPNQINSLTQLEEFIEEQSKQIGLNTEKPLPYLIEGNAKSLNWHIIDWKDGNTEHTHQKHKESGLNGIEENIEIEIIGFFSKSHKAVFTHHSTFLHMHFKTKDEKLAGHVDELTLGNQMILRLPKSL